MKKNKFMKLASGLLVLCLMTTCVIGATLAKYVTSGNGSDQARVAKWGVRVSAATNSTFATKYDIKDEDSQVGTLSVQSSADPADNVVAPGTSGPAAAFSITGTPEVAVRVAFVVDNVSDVVLKKGNYKYDGTDTTINVAADYLPVKFTLTQTKSDSPAETLVNGGTLAKVKTELEKLSKRYAPNADLEKEIGTLKLSWTWEFDEGAGVNDVADTLLGDLAADANAIKKDNGSGTAVALVTAPYETADYNLTVSYNLKITITQVD